MRRRRLALIPAVVLLLIGLVWTLQGIGILKGSFMTGARFWEGIGLVCIVAAVGIGWFALAGGRRRAA
jgi:uncharacterized membrane protein